MFVFFLKKKMTSGMAGALIGCKGIKDFKVLRCFKTIKPVWFFFLYSGKQGYLYQSIGICQTTWPKTISAISAGPYFRKATKSA